MTKAEGFLHVVERLGTVTPEYHLRRGPEMPPPALFSPSTDEGERRPGEGRELPRVFALGSIPTRGRSPGREKRMWVAEA